MRVSQQFTLLYDPCELDFVDIDVTEDRKFFVDPHAIRLARTAMSREATGLIQRFFSHLLDVIRTGKDGKAYEYLRYLLEPNETHFGYSVKFSRGRALGPDSAQDVLNALKKSTAVQTGLLRDLEDAALLIEGIDRDIVSDMATNIIRPILVTYTQQMAALYGIPTQPVKIGAIWDAEASEWRTGDVADLPIGPRGALLFVPKLFVRIVFERDRREYHRNHVAPALEAEEIVAGSALVKLLKSGEPRVTKKDLKKEHGDGKPTTIRVTQRRPDLLDDYRKAIGERIRRAVSQEDLAEVLKAPKPKWKTLAENTVAIPCGAAHADSRGHGVLGFSTALLHPNVTSPAEVVTSDEFRAWRFHAVSNADGPLSAALAAFPSDTVDLVALNDDLTPDFVPVLLKWFARPDAASLTVVVARSVHKKAAKVIAKSARGVLLLGDADLQTLGEHRAAGPEAIPPFFVAAD